MDGCWNAMLLFKLLKVTFLQWFNLVKASNLIKKIYVEARRITFSKQNTMLFFSSFIIMFMLCLDVNHCNNPSTEVDNVSRSISPPLLFISSQHIAKTGVTLQPLRDCMLMLLTKFSILFPKIFYTRMRNDNNEHLENTYLYIYHCIV